jgi:hypothetical protein
MKKVLLLALALGGMIAPALAQADVQAPEKLYSLQIERQPLVGTLRDLSKQTGLQLVGLLGSNAADEARVVGPLNGDYTAEAALNVLLAQSSLVFKRVNEKTIAIIGRYAATETNRELIDNTQSVVHAK